MDPKIELLQLPPEVIDMVIQHLGIADKKNLRLVCQKFRNQVERQIKYVVVLNDTTSDTVRKFVPGKKITTLVVEDYTKELKSTSSTRSVLANKEVEELVLAGRSHYKLEKKTTAQAFVYPYLLNEKPVNRRFEHWVSMGNYKNSLAKLNLNYIINFTNQTITSLVVSSDIFVDCKNSSMFQLPTLFPNLKCLQIALATHVTSIHTPVEMTILKIFERRFSYLRKLTFKSECTCTTVTINQWMKFYQFLITHSRTLKEVQMCHHSHFEATGVLENNLEAKKIFEDLKKVQLCRLSLVILNNMKGFPQNEIFINSFEIQLLRSQRQLRVLKLDFGYLYAGEIFEMLPICEHLYGCSIHIFGSRIKTIIKLDFLKKSKDLKVLQIICDEDYRRDDSPWKLKGIESLPNSLEFLSLSTDLSRYEAYWIENNLPKLREIRYHRGIRREIDGSAMLMNSTNNFNYIHFQNCIKNMATLKAFVLGIPNLNITLRMHEVDVNFEVKSNFLMGFPPHEQH